MTGGSWRLVWEQPHLFSCDVQSVPPFPRVLSTEGREGEQCGWHLFSLFLVQQHQWPLLMGQPWEPVAGRWEAVVCVLPAQKWARQHRQQLNPCSTTAFLRWETGDGKCCLASWKLAGGFPEIWAGLGFYPQFSVLWFFPRVCPKLELHMLELHMLELSSVATSYRAQMVLSKKDLVNDTCQLNSVASPVCTAVLTTHSVHSSC